MNNKTPIDSWDWNDKDIAGFWARVDKRLPDECWPWTGGTTKAGGFVYGVLAHRSLTVKAHRVAYMLAHGAVDPDLTVDHVAARGCTSKLCCNPKHLEQITQAENTLRQHTDPDRLYSLTCKHGHIRRFIPWPKPMNCAKCAIAAVKRSQAKKPDKYRKLSAASKKRTRHQANEQLKEITLTRKEQANGD